MMQPGTTPGLLPSTSITAAALWTAAQSTAAATAATAGIAAGPSPYTSFSPLAMQWWLSRQGGASLGVKRGRDDQQGSGQGPSAKLLRGVGVVKREGDLEEDKEGYEEAGGWKAPRRTRTGRQLRAPAKLRDDLGHKEAGRGRGRGRRGRPRKEGSQAGGDSSDQEDEKAPEEQPAVVRGGHSARGRRKSAAAVVQRGGPAEVGESSSEEEEVRYTGVRPMKPGGVLIFRSSQYMPTARHGKKTIHWGSYPTAKAAAKARDLIAVGLQGVHSMNFPPESYTLEQVRGAYVELMAAHPQGFFPDGLLRTALRQCMVSGVPARRATATAGGAAAGGGGGGGGGRGVGTGEAGAAGVGSAAVGAVAVNLVETCRVRVMLEVVKATATACGGSFSGQGGLVGEEEPREMEIDQGQQQQQQGQVEQEVVKQQQQEQLSQEEEQQEEEQQQQQLASASLHAPGVGSMEVDDDLAVTKTAAPSLPSAAAAALIDAAGTSAAPGDATAGSSVPATAAGMGTIIVGNTAAAAAAYAAGYVVRLHLAVEPAVDLQLDVAHQNQQQQQQQVVQPWSTVGQAVASNAAAAKSTEADATAGVGAVGVGGLLRPDGSPSKKKVGDAGVVTCLYGLRLG